MDILQLKYFCHAATTLNFSKTAQAFFVPPSNISQCIKRLESELGVPLFIRSSNRIQLSPQGELFYKGVKNSLELLDSTTQAVKTSVSEKTIRVAISMRRLTVIRIIELFKSKYPGVQIVYEIPNNPAYGFSFEGYDLIIAGQNYEHPDFKRELLAHNKLVLFAPKDMLSPDSITPEVLQKQVFISHPPGSYMYRNTQILCQNLNISPQILTQEKHSIYFIPRCIEEKRGIAFAPQPTVWAIRMAEYLDVFDVGEYYTDAFIFSKKETISPYVISLNELIKTEYRNQQLDLMNSRKVVQRLLPTALTQR